MDPERKLSPRELRWALDHAMTTHLLAEEQRDRAVACTTLAEFRELLLDSDLPEADVDAALATLDGALESRRQAGRRQRRGLAVFASGFLIAGLAGYLLSAGSASGPTVFVNLRHEQPGLQARSSWGQGNALGGAGEREIADALNRAGLRVVEQLEPKQVRRLFVGAGVEPSLAAIRAATPASLAALGEARCVQIGGAAGEGAKEMRVMLALRVKSLDGDATVARAAAEGKGLGADVATACEQAAQAAARAMAPGIAAQVAAQAGLPQDQEKR